MLSIECTFIVLSNSPDDQNKTDVDRMAGDVNIFLNNYDDNTDAELDIMIAEEIYRRKGYAKEAVLLMMDYGIRSLNIKRYYVKISKDNIPSLSLFRRYLNSFNSCTIPQLFVCLID
jgi:RimJ/RimL family protein N-acetyltransferase